MVQQQTETAPVPERRDWFGLATLAVGLGMIVLDGTIVGVALPGIIIDLGLDLTDAQWVGSLYAVVLAALLLVMGRLADRFGRRRLFIAGVVVFLGGSLLAAAADGAASLLLARAVQAVGAAGIMPASLSTVNATFRGRYRAAAFGVWGAVISGAAAVGPLAGGLLTHFLSWQWIFLVNLPLGILVAIATLLTVRATRGDVGEPGADVVGAVLSAIAFGGLVLAVIEGPDLGWWRPSGAGTLGPLSWGAEAPLSPVPIVLAVAIAALVAFVAWERRRAALGRSALLDVALFRLPTFRWGNLTAGTVAVGEFAIVFVLPLYLVNALGLDVLGAGWVLAAMAIGAFLSGAAARHLAARIGAAGTVLVGLALELVGVLVLAFVLGAGTPAWLVGVPLVVYGLGLGLASAQLTGTVLRDVPPAESGQGSATQSTVRQIGSALGTAFAGAALSVALATTLPSALADAGVDDAAATQLATATRSSAGSSIGPLREAGASGPLGDRGPVVVDALSAGFADATRVSLLVAAGFLVLGLVGASRVAAAARAGAEPAVRGSADAPAAGDGHE